MDIIPTGEGVYQVGEGVYQEEKQKTGTHTNETNTINSIASSSISQKKNDQFSFQDHTVTKKNTIIFEPSHGLKQAQDECKQNPKNYLELARLKSYINEYDRRLEKQPFWIRIATFISRRIFFSASIAQADQLFIKNYVTLNPSERGYIDFVDSFDRASITFLAEQNKNISLPGGGTYSGPINYGLPDGGMAKEINFNGGKYTGPMRNGKPSGEGTVENFNFHGGKYNGPVRNGEPSGDGYVFKFKYELGGFYSGPVKDGDLSGKGYIIDLKLEEGVETYTGESFNGIPHGVGKLNVEGKFSCDCKYENGFRVDKGPSEELNTQSFFKISNKGEIIDENGLEGIDGEDLHIFSDESINVSSENQVKNGYVENLELDNGMLFTGNIQKGLPHGEGVLEINGKVHEVVYANGKLIKLIKDGETISTIKSEEQSINKGANFYAGVFIDLNLNGEGETVRRNKTVEKGNFFLGQLDGYGERISPKGIKQKGIFQKGVFIKEARIIDNITYYCLGEGKFKGDLLNGTGAMEFKNEQGFVTIKGTFREGKLNGPAIQTIGSIITYPKYENGELKI